MVKKYSYIPTRLKNAAENDYVAGAEDILDDALNKTQEEINGIVLTPSTGIDDRLKTIEQGVTFEGTIQTETNPANVTSGSAKVPTGNAVRGAIDVRTGYFKCTTASGTAAKAVTADGYVLSRGGGMRIFMEHANTADNATLNINSTGPKALFYNGERAGSGNSWEDKETITVYYDETANSNAGAYYASNAQGGGGKFATGEKLRETDIDTVPTGGSNGVVKSSGIYVALNIEVPLNLNAYDTKTCSMGASTWYSNGASGKHKAIPVTPGDILHVKTQYGSTTVGAYVGWLSTGYTGSATNNQPVPYVSGTGRFICADQVLTAPEGAAYLCLTVVAGDGVNINNEVYTFQSIKEKVSNDDAAPIENSSKYVSSGGIYDALETGLSNKVNKKDVIQSYDISVIEQRDCSLGTSAWYMSGSAGRHKYIEVTPGHLYVLDKTCYIGWLTDAYDTENEYKKDDPIPYVSGTDRIWSTAGNVYKAPVGASYMIIVTVDGGGASYAVSEVNDIESTSYDLLQKDFLKIRDVVGDLNDTFNIVDLSAYPVTAGVLRKGYGTWYVAGGYSHIAVPVNAGEVYIIDFKTWGNYGLLQSYSGTGSNPVYSASATDRIDRDPGQYRVIIPADCTYIVFSATSGGVNTMPSLMCELKILPWVIDQIENGGGGFTPIKIRYAHWNVGHFSYYNRTLGGMDTTITEEMSPVMQKRYKAMINKVAPDIFGICEYNPEFDLAGNLTKDTILKWYKYQFIGAKHNYPCNSIFSNIKGVSYAEKFYTSHNQSTYYKAAKMYFGNTEVYVVETHLDWDSVDGVSRAYIQMDELINDFANFDHVIISGDFNVNFISQYQKFIDAGYTLASGSYVDCPTYLRYLIDDDENNNEGLYLDNIVVKGFAVSNVKAWDESGWSQGVTTKYILTVKAGTGSGNISINGNTVAVTANESADSVAGKIASGVSIEGWNLTADGSNVIVECNTVGENKLPIKFNAGNTGVNLLGTSIPAELGVDDGLSDHSIISCDLLLLP